MRRNLFSFFQSDMFLERDMFSYPVLEKVELYCLEPEQNAVIDFYLQTRDVQQIIWYCLKIYCTFRINIILYIITFQRNTDNFVLILCRGP